jgi:glutaredoxin-related protein
VINFDEVLELDAIKYLQGKKKEVFDFMSLFTSTDTKDFSAKIEQFKNLIAEERLTLDEVLKKKQYVQICSLSLENSNHKFDDLAKLLNVIFISAFSQNFKHFLKIRLRKMMLKNGQLKQLLMVSLMQKSTNSKKKL